jgi:Mor family transcriptional regulator
MSMEIGQTSASIRRHELLADMAEQTALRLISEHGMEEEKACDVGNDLADFLSRHWGGQSVYIAVDDQFRLSKRDMQIYQRMQRGNAHELGKEFGLSFVRVYQIYRRCLTAMRKRAQPSLFSDPEEKLSTGDQPKFFNKKGTS